MKSPIQLEQDFQSPEGLDERVKQIQGFIITLTQGGKHRIYLDNGKEIVPVTIADTLEAAEKRVASMQAMFAGMVFQPERTMEAMFSSLKKGTPE